MYTFKYMRILLASLFFFFCFPTFTFAQDVPPVTGPGNLVGDANGDGKIDGLDFVIWLNNYRINTSNGSQQGDFDYNGVVDGIDYVMWLNNYLLSLF